MTGLTVESKGSYLAWLKVCLQVHRGQREPQGEVSLRLVRGRCLACQVETDSREVRPGQDQVPAGQGSGDNPLSDQTPTMAAGRHYKLSGLKELQKYFHKTHSSFLTCLIAGTEKRESATQWEPPSTDLQTAGSGAGGGRLYQTPVRDHQLQARWGPGGHCEGGERGPRQGERSAQLQPLSQAGHHQHGLSQASGGQGGRAGPGPDQGGEGAPWQGEPAEQGRPDQARVEAAGGDCGPLAVLVILPDHDSLHAALPRHPPLQPQREVFLSARQEEDKWQWGPSGDRLMQLLMDDARNEKFGLIWKTCNFLERFYLWPRHQRVNVYFSPIPLGFR